MDAVLVKELWKSSEKPVIMVFNWVGNIALSQVLLVKNWTMTDTRSNNLTQTAWSL